MGDSSEVVVGLFSFLRSFWNSNPFDASTYFTDTLSFDAAIFLAAEATEYPACRSG